MRRKEMRSNIELGPGENVVLNFVCGYILAVFCRSCIVKCFRNSNTKQIIFVKEFFKSIVFRKKNQIFMNLQIASKFNCKVLNLYNIILLNTTFLELTFPNSGCRSAATLWLFRSETRVKFAFWLAHPTHPFPRWVAEVALPGQ